MAWADRTDAVPNTFAGRPGPTDLSVNRLKSAMTPSQLTWFMHPEIGKTAQYAIRLGEVPILEPNPKTGIYTPVRPSVQEATP